MVHKKVPVSVIERVLSVAGQRRQTSPAQAISEAITPEPT
jgi:hypothetical protein